MDIFKIIRELHEERERINRVIAALEELARAKEKEGSSALRPGAEEAASTGAGSGKRKRGRPRKSGPTAS